MVRMMAMHIFCAFMDQNGAEVHKQTQGQYPNILTKEAW